MSHTRTCAPLTAGRSVSRPSRHASGLGRREGCGQTGGAAEAGAQQCALLAVLRPVLLGFEPSQLAECADLRALAPLIHEEPCARGLACELRVWGVCEMTCWPSLNQK